MTTEDRAEQAVMQFKQRRHLYKKLKDIAVHEIEEALRDSGLNSKIHGRVNARVKKTDSLRKKIADRGLLRPAHRHPR